LVLNRERKKKKKASGTERVQDGCYTFATESSSNRRGISLHGHATRPCDKGCLDSLVGQEILLKLYTDLTTTMNNHLWSRDNVKLDRFVLEE